MSRSLREIVVLGGGLSGLSLAFFLRRALGPTAAARIRVVEAAPRAGGWIHTAERDNFVFEEGPRGFRPSRNGAEMLRLVEELGLESEMRAVDARARARYVLRDGVVERLPMGLLELLRWPLTPAVIKAGIHDVMTTTTATAEDESVYDFIARRFSPVVAERLLDPVASGIFGGDIRYLSVRACFRVLWELERTHGSVIRGMLLGRGANDDARLLDGSVKSPFVRAHENAVSVSFERGMSTLIRALEQRIETDECDELHVGTRVRALAVPRTAAKGGNDFTLVTEDTVSGREETIHASHVFSTLPAFALEPLVRESLPGLAATLRTIRFVSMGTVHVGYQGPVLPSDGFGYLVPSCEGERVLGVVFDSNAFPSQNARDAPLQTRLSVMAGGAHFDEITTLPPAELEALALDALRRHLGITAPPDFVRSVVLRDCIPQYHVGFDATVAALEAQLVPGLRLGGNSFYGIGLADCVTRSKALALEFARAAAAAGSSVKTAQ